MLSIVTPVPKADSGSWFTVIAAYLLESGPRPQSVFVIATFYMIVSKPNLLAIFQVGVQVRSFITSQATSLLSCLIAVSNLFHRVNIFFRYLAILVIHLALDRLRGLILFISKVNLKFRQYSAINTNYSLSNGTISN